MARAQHATDRSGFLAGGGDTGQLIAARDWSRTSVGAMSGWPPAMRSTLAAILASPLPIVTLWGEAGVMIYNDAYSQFAGPRHPALLGTDVREAWPEVAEFNDNVIRRVFRRGETLSYKAQHLLLHRAGRADDAWLNLDYSPLVDEDGTRLGVMAIVIEVTESVIADRQLQSERARLHQLYEQSPSFKALLEGPDHRIVMCNDAYRRLVGQRDLIGRSVSDAVPEAAEQGFIALLDAAYATGETFTANGQRFEVRRRPDGPAEEGFADLVFQPIRDFSGEVSGIFIEGVDVTDRVHAERATAASEGKFRTFAQAVPNHIWTAPADGQLDWFNERAFDYGRLSFDELKGDGWARMVHPDDLPAAAKLWTSALATGTVYQTEFRLRRHDGEYRWHLARALPIVAEDGAITRWVGSNTDIHEQKLAELQSTRDRDRLWTLSQNLMLICDLDGVITSINPAAHGMLGYDATDMHGRRIADLVHPEDVASTMAELAKLASGVTPQAFKNRYRCLDGSYKLIEWTAVPDTDRIHAVGRDITEEERLARDRERIWSLSPIVKAIADSSGQILAVNPSWTTILGWSSEETVGRNLLDFLLPREVEEAGERLKAVAASTETVVDKRRTFMAKDGREHHLAWTTVPEAGALYLFGRDMTAEVEQAEALATAEEALRQSQKMEAVGQLTGGIAHDFNNLLQGITGSLEIIERRVKQGRMDDLERFITGANGAASRAAALTHRLLAFSRRQPLDPRPVEVNPLLSSMEDLFRRTIGERIDLKLVLDEAPWLTRCDPNQLENALLNLVINARDAMPDGGRLTIETCNARLDDIELGRERVIPADHYVCIGVSDTGGGMNIATIAKAFEPFFTTKPMGQGTGLGLSMIYGFARQSEGMAKIYSEVGHGTTVKLFLPRFHGEAEAPDRPDGSVDDGAAGRGKTILVIEDDPVVRAMIVEVLRELRYGIIEAEDGPRGVAILQSDARIDLLVTDIGLPGLNGRQVADAGRSKRPGLKVMFMTGYAENAALAKGFLEPGMAMITKPFAIDALSSRIRSMLEGH